MGNFEEEMAERIMAEVERRNPRTDGQVSKALLYQVTMEVLSLFKDQLMTIPDRIEGGMTPEKTRRFKLMVDDVWIGYEEKLLRSLGLLKI